MFPCIHRPREIGLYLILAANWALHAPTLPNWVHPAVVALYGVSKYLSPAFVILLYTYTTPPSP